MKKLKMWITVILLALGSLMAYSHPSYGIAVDSQGNIYFADLFHNGMGSVWKLSAEGELTLLFGNFHAHNLSLDDSGNLYTAHGEGDHTMIRYGTNGSIDTLINTRDINRFFGGNAVFSKGKIFFQIEKQVWSIDTEGTKSAFSDHKFDWNQSLFVDDKGNVYGPDLGKGDGYGEVIKISPDGSAEVVAEDLFTIPERGYDPHQDVLLGMAKDENGFLYIAETAGRRILRFDESGNQENFYVAESPWFPTGITFYNDNAYILEFKSEGGYGGPRITKLSGDVSEVIFDYDSHINPVKSEEKENGGPPVWTVGLMMAGAMLIFISIILILRNRTERNPVL